MPRAKRAGRAQRVNPGGPASVDWYEILEVSPRATQAVIHAAYRALARESHPDRNPSPDAAKRIRQLNAAFRVLGDHDLRARYDLQRARVRRNERSAARSEPHADSEASDAKRLEVPLPARASGLRRPVEEPRAVLNTHPLLVLLMVAALTAIVLVLVWMTLDPAAGGGALAPVPGLETYHRVWASD